VCHGKRFNRETLQVLFRDKYSIADACKLGVFLHGKAGDLARDKYSEHSMLASDIIAEIGPAFLKLS